MIIKGNFADKDGIYFFRQVEIRNGTITKFDLPFADADFKFGPHYLIFSGFGDIHGRKMLYLQ